MEKKICPHLNCLIYHGEDNPCTCDMARYCQECNKGEQTVKLTENRLKTLEEENKDLKQELNFAKININVSKKKIKFIMENSVTKNGIVAIWESMDSGKAFKIGHELYVQSLKDLCDEENKPSVKEEVEQRIKNNYPCKCSCHKEMSLEELYPDDRPMTNCGLCCLSVKEDSMPMVIDYGNADKKKEILDEFDDKFNKFGECNPPHCINIRWGGNYRDLESWLSDKLDELIK